MIQYFRGPCHISITTMTQPTLDPRPKTASDWRCPWQQLESHSLYSLSLSCLLFSLSLNTIRSCVRKHVDLAHISLHRQGRQTESSIVNVCLQRQHTSQSQIPPAVPLALCLCHLSPRWGVDMQSSGSENLMLTISPPPTEVANGTLNKV